MERETDELAHLLSTRIQEIPKNSRLLVGLSGIPASGKSTLAEVIVKKTRILLADDGELKDVGVVLVGLDGWHLTRAQLDAMPDPKLAHDRRGIHWTFDGPSYVSFIQTLRQPITETTPVVYAPSFDHAVKDPEPDSVHVRPNDRIILIEGLYTFLSIEPWVEGAQLLDERWLIDVDFDEAQDRLLKRHVASGVAKDYDEAVWRATNNDMPNGRFVMANSLEPTRTILSLSDPVLMST
ncbi:hypothetical protein ONZ45_g4067 [Pleurotus djamor]|nr:hypothetical protein ONZ45_g4067 [Pleurotus djamor]